jgi:hypothetical protein
MILESLKQVAGVFRRTPAFANIAGAFGPASMGVGRRAAIVKRNARIDIAKPPIPDLLFFCSWFQDCDAGPLLRLLFYGVGSLTKPTRFRTASVRGDTDVAIFLAAKSYGLSERLSSPAAKNRIRQGRAGLDLPSG